MVATPAPLPPRLVRAHAWVPADIVFNLAGLRLDEPPAPLAGAAHAPEHTLQPDGTIGNTVTVALDTTPLPAAALQAGNAPVPNDEGRRTSAVVEARNRLAEAAAVHVAATDNHDEDWPDRAREAYVFIDEHRAELTELFGYESDSEPDEPDSNWHVVTRGVNTGVFHSWVRTSPLVTGISHNAHQGVDSKDEGTVKFITALAANGVLRLRRS